MRGVAEARRTHGPPMTVPPRIAVIDYGAGNLRSVVKALARSRLDPVVTGDPDALRRADALVEG